VGYSPAKQIAIMPPLASSSPAISSTPEFLVDVLLFHEKGRQESHHGILRAIEQHAFR